MGGECGQVKLSILSKASVLEPTAASLTHRLVFNGSAVIVTPLHWNIS